MRRGLLQQLIHWRKSSMGLYVLRNTCMYPTRPIFLAWILMNNIRIQFQITDKLGIDRFYKYDRNVFPYNGNVSYLYPQYPDGHKSSCRHVNELCVGGQDLEYTTFIVEANTSFLLPGYSWALGPFSFDYSLYTVVFGGVANCIL